ncbi:AAA family ATPase [Streptomyces fulvoviolaceus]|uniref:AAA family ATPase n=1 Tax=Streptomyces fulvoviolaceus TaxID=285535 RepID=UPI0004C9A2E2|nr:AAA family ATPase [Streptomyces fulvoviolaceus]
MSSQDDLFHPVIELPEPTRQARYDRLIGLDTVKRQLRKEAVLLADPDRLHAWARQHHPGTDPAALQLFADRAPLFVFSGDVGSGKSALAESFGCDLAEQLDLPVYLYRLKLATRGSGLVGEMTALIGDAFSYVHEQGRRARDPRGVNTVLVLVVDEADALVQSREAQQMHHEDRAGVDAFLAGVDSLAGARLPVLVVLCTNRVGALDPALMRRAAATFTFVRPDDQQRRAVLTRALHGITVRPDTFDKLVQLTGPDTDRPGYTFSDLTQRLVPAAVLQAFPDGPLRDEHLLTVANELAPSPVFAETP